MNKDSAKFAKRIESLCDRYNRNYQRSRGMGSSATYYVDLDNSELRLSGHSKPDSGGLNYNVEEWETIILAVADGSPLKAVDKAYITKANKARAEKEALTLENKAVKDDSLTICEITKGNYEIIKTAKHSKTSNYCFLLTCAGQMKVVFEKGTNKEIAVAEFVNNLKGRQ